MKKQKRNNFKGKVFSVAVLVFSILIFVGDYNNRESLYSVESKDREVIYPRQYSDRSITENAINTDQRFKSVAFLKSEDQISNAISSIIKTDTNKVEYFERATWLWTPTLLLTEKYMDEIISGAKKNNLNVIYLSIDSYLDIYVMSDSKEKKEVVYKFDNALRKFISKANSAGIAVDAEAGWQNWAMKGNLYKPIAVLDYVINFNKKYNEKFRGFQYDVEVYLLPEYKDNKSKELKNFLSLIDKSITKLNNTDLVFSVVIPEFYDGSTKETPKFRYKGKRTYTFDHLLSSLQRRGESRVIVMSYRNFSQGFDGTIDISKDEIYNANNLDTKIIIAQETGDFPPPYITFHNTSKKYFGSQLEQVESAFSSEKSFGGIAIHYINSFLTLK